jgi:molybdenum cofactor cytidylyltransferase
VLAAGLARRFGGGKLVATFGGRPLVSHVLDAVSAAQARGLLAGTYVVAAEGDGLIADLTRRVGAILVPNPDPSRGLSSSLKLGLAALPGTLDAALVLLGDQPMVRVEVIESLIDAWQEGGTGVVRPRYARAPDTPGHPVLLARPIWRLAGGLEGDSGFSLQFSPGAADVRVIDVPGDNPDVNTPADLLALEDRHR